MKLFLIHLNGLLKGVSKEKNNLQDIPFEAVKWWYDIFNDKNCVIIKNLDEIKDVEPLTYEYLKPQNIHSLITVPLHLGDEIIGFFGVDNPPEKLTENVDNMAEMVSHFIVSLLEKRRLMNQLEKLSFRDSLTDVKNRHALTANLEQYKSLEKVGILYCDVLGLKKINDNLGHKEGDNLILRAVQVLQTNFRTTDIYRLGGDEFMVMCIGIDETKFYNKIENIRKVMPNYNATMSMGAVWERQTNNVDSIIAEADKLMYEEKQAYYAVHGRR